MRQGCRFGWEPCPLASLIKALVWHVDRMAEDVSHGPSQNFIIIISSNNPGSPPPVFKAKSVFRHSDNALVSCSVDKLTDCCHIFCASKGEIPNVEGASAIVPPRLRRESHPRRSLT